MPDALVIVNPAARAGRALPGLIGAAVEVLRRNGWRCEVVNTRQAADASALAARPGFDLVVAAGGDGTINEVVTGLLRGSRSGTVPTLAVLPAGTGNDVARFLGVLSPAAALAALETGRTASWDVIGVECQGREGRLVQRHALLFAGAGFVGEVIRLTTPRVKSLFGATVSYAVGFFRALGPFHPARFQVRGPLLDYAGPLLTALAANASHAGGGGMRLGPGARLDDGYFDVSLIRSLSRWQVAGQFLRLTRGTHVRHPAVKYFPATWLEIDAVPAQVVVADGEIVGQTPVRLVLHPKALSLLHAPG